MQRFFFAACLGRRPVQWVFALVALTLVGACSGAGTLSDSAAMEFNTPRLEGVRWTLQVLAGQTVNPVDAQGDLDPHLQLSEGRLFARVGCNSLMTNYHLNGDFLKFVSPMGSTKMGCFGDRGALERLFIITLGQVQHVRIQGQGMFFLNAQKQVVAQFTSSAAGR